MEELEEEFETRISRMWSSGTTKIGILTGVLNATALPPLNYNNNKFWVNKFHK